MMLAPAGWTPHPYPPTAVERGDGPVHDVVVVRVRDGAVRSCACVVCGCANVVRSHWGYSEGVMWKLGSILPNRSGWARGCAMHGATCPFSEPDSPAR